MLPLPCLFFYPSLLTSKTQLPHFFFKVLLYRRLLSSTFTLRVYLPFSYQRRIFPSFPEFVPTSSACKVFVQLIRIQDLPLQLLVRVSSASQQPTKLTWLSTNQETCLSSSPPDFTAFSSGKMVKKSKAPKPIDPHLQQQLASLSVPVHLEALLLQITNPNTQQIAAAEVIVKAYLKMPECCVGFVQQLQGSQHAQVSIYNHRYLYTLI